MGGGEDANEKKGRVMGVLFKKKFPFIIQVTEVDYRILLRPHTDSKLFCPLCHTKRFPKACSYFLIELDFYLNQQEMIHLR